MIAAGAVVLAAAGLQAPSPWPPTDLGPAVGQTLPDFQATDQDGRLRDFQSLRGPNGLVLLFVRSADW